MFTPPAAVSPPGPVLSAIGVSAGYGASAVLSELNLCLAPGEIYALLGGNGAGKTTTLKLFLGFIPARRGQVHIAGIEVARDVQAARQRLAYVPENVALYGSLSARENLDYFLTLAHGRSPHRDSVEAALQAVALPPEAWSRPCDSFSKGMRQKVALALALARAVPVLLLDEPTSGLDPRAIDDFHQLLEGVRARGVAVLMVTHDLLGAATVSDRIGFLRDGRLVDEFAPGPEPDLATLQQHYLGRRSAVSSGPARSPLLSV